MQAELENLRFNFENIIRKKFDESLQKFKNLTGLSSTVENELNHKEKRLYNELIKVSFGNIVVICNFFLYAKFKALKEFFVFYRNILSFKIVSKSVLII